MDMKYPFIIVMAIVLTACSSASTDKEDLIAIDVLLEPDQAMLDRASEWNKKMLELTPEGFQLDSSHRPHITLIQRHIRKRDLHDVLAAIDAVRARIDLGRVMMTANGLYHIPVGDLGLAGITVEPTDELLELQAAVIDAVNAYHVGAADENAYVPDPTGAPFDPFLFEYVDTYVPNQTGSNFNPHVTIGLAPKAWLTGQEQNPFSEFNFAADGIAVYQLGNFGTASKRLDK